MKPSFVLSTLLAALSFAGAAHAVPATAPHAAACVAALKANEVGLIATLKAGAPVESELLKVVRSGIAIIGTQYLAGLRESEARPLLEAAEKDFEALPRSAAVSRQAQCLQEGQALYKNASPIEQNLITSAAQRRIQKRLKKAA
ncbi:MAG: hypothetical protein K8R60_09885 [Burkholderiales bacterium]|nr:hypothetical protein [Burkholderiales bacterium]